MRKERVKKRGCVRHEEIKNKGERETPELNFHMKGEVLEQREEREKKRKRGRELKEKL